MVYLYDEIQDGRRFVKKSLTEALFWLIWLFLDTFDAFFKKKICCKTGVHLPQHICLPCWSANRPCDFDDDMTVTEIGFCISKKANIGGKNLLSNYPYQNISHFHLIQLSSPLLTTQQRVMQTPPDCAAPPLDRSAWHPNPPNKKLNTPIL